MSLYYDAAAVLTSTCQDGSLKSRIYNNKLGLKSKPPQIYALVSETAKYDDFLKEVIDNTGLLAKEPKLTPILSLLLVHDHFLAKKGIAAPLAHPLRVATERHKARLQAEFTKARLRRKCASLDALRSHLGAAKPSLSRSQPRWVRINTLKTTLEQELETTFKGHRICATIAELVDALPTENILYLDRSIPDLIALAPDIEVTKTQAYKDGKLILQDKASCFPAYMLVGKETETTFIGDCIDGCAAPGNKTSHLAALLAKTGTLNNVIYACERDARRSETLKSMMKKSAADAVVIQAECDFLKLDPHGREYQEVTHLLLDPSCSGSGILGREDIPVLALPEDPRVQKSPTDKALKSSRKRKRDHETPKTDSSISADSCLTEEIKEAVVDKSRLEKLSNLQTRIVEHALSFPAAAKVTYSTCSVHVEENEAVVGRILACAAAKERGWRLLRRKEQVDGMRLWPHRGVTSSEWRKTEQESSCLPLIEEELEACIRCDPGTNEGTMGFFVCCFVRSVPSNVALGEGGHLVEKEIWEGFND